MNDEQPKRASATPEELDTMVAAEAVLTETRETVEALTVSALQQAHAMSHRAETGANSVFQHHKDMTVTTKEQARKKQLNRDANKGGHTSGAIENDERRLVGEESATSQ